MVYFIWSVSIVRPHSRNTYWWPMCMTLSKMQITVSAIKASTESLSGKNRATSILALSRPSRIRTTSVGPTPRAHRSIRAPSVHSDSILNPWITYLTHWTHYDLSERSSTEINLSMPSAASGTCGCPGCASSRAFCCWGGVRNVGIWRLFMWPLINSVSAAALWTWPWKAALLPAAKPSRAPGRRPASYWLVPPTCPHCQWPPPPPSC